jgi:hypothetical protein
MFGSPMTVTKTVVIVMGLGLMQVIFFSDSCHCLSISYNNFVLGFKDWAAGNDMEGIGAEADTALMLFIDEFANAGPFEATGWRVSKDHCIILWRR